MNLNTPLLPRLPRSPSSPLRAVPPHPLGKSSLPRLARQQQRRRRLVLAPRMALDSSGGTRAGDKHVIVCGAGVVGACTAYFLAQKGVRVTVVEREGVACAASGKAGGFLAFDWCRGPLGKLARTSFDLHAQLASQLGVDYGYRRLETLSAYLEETSEFAYGAPEGKEPLPRWVDGALENASLIGTQTSTAQVHPRLFTQAVLEAAIHTGRVELLMGEVTDVRVEEKPIRGGGPLETRVSEVVLHDREALPAEEVVMCLGPWSSRNPLVRRVADISGLKAHSIVMKPREPRAITGHALFLQYRTLEGRVMEPEVYPRPDGEVYICGLSEEVPVPEDPSQVLPTPGSCSVLRRAGECVSSHLSTAEVVAEQACFLPLSPDGLPLIGALPGVSGAYVATGHSCWGILNAPATGLAIAELIADGAASTVDLKAFDPKRFVRKPSSLFGSLV